ncbi:Fe3+-binding periplasmic protein [Dokdonia sp. MED134]|uniref:ABC transporter substrate-binding protein n=1 Tax=Dokdonia sp. MED134 TaxID=313590 RepID=UPI0000689BA7|nr:helical backbone metal receptor [Dokdonia sp. MED134]EAQ38359.1 Fe3+-binding periplasmic protein [Dokdonia sp. MED134]
MHIVDQMGRSLTFDHTPVRIVSLVPSQTELLVDLGLQSSLVGITKFCVHPVTLRNEVSVVGGTKQVHYDKIKALQPDIILCNKEENTEEMVRILQDIATVHLSDVKTLQDAHNLIIQYGTIFNVTQRATAITTRIKEEQERFRESITNPINTLKVGYFIWQEPLMVVGDDTFIHHILEELGFVNAFKNKEGRYPTVTEQDLKDLDYVFLSSEPFPFSEKHIEAFQKKTTAQVVLVDGEYFSWYGSRLIKAFPYFTSLSKRLKL